MPELRPDPRSDRRHVQSAVFSALHARLRSKEKRPVLDADDDAIWVTWHGEHPPVEYRIVGAKWWLPATDTHVNTLAASLLAGLRAALEERRLTARSGT